MDGGNGLPGGMLPTSMGSGGGLLGLEMSLHGHQQMHQHNHSQQQTHHMLPFQAPAAIDGDHQAQHPIRHAQFVPPFDQPARGKQQPAMSSEEDSGYGEEVDDQARRGGVSQPSPSPSPWQRMKWTNSMVQFLIQVVYRVGDDGGGADGEQQQPHGALAKGKKSAVAASSASPASAMLQKKGKWKSVSGAMMEKGFCVSPQQCEDKFNDLNKRYKRVNDLLGKGTACQVVKNRALLDTMDHLSPKAKEEARKLLNSKHLFFREMCAYHLAGGGSSCAAPLPPQIPSPPPPDRQQPCFHLPPSTGKALGGSRGGGATAEEEAVAEEADDDDGVDSEEEEDYDEDEDEEDDYVEDHNHKHHHHQHQHKHEEEEEDDEDSKEFVAGSAAAKRQKRTSSQMSASPPLSLTLSSPSGSVQQLRSELTAMSVGGEQQQQWLRRRAAELEEQRVAFQCRALHLERQRFKWLRFSAKKEREMERTKLDNERLRLENDRMLLLLRQKEFELTHGAGGGGVSSTAVPSAEQQQPMIQATNANPKQGHVPNGNHASTRA